MTVKKRYLTSKPECRCTFVLPAEAAREASTVALAGDFNDWSTTSHPMKRLKSGDFKIEINLPVGQQYQYRFFTDQGTWENDWSAEAYVPASGLAVDNSLVTV
ncbi:isoamylase early set domain-containing protein [Saccharospirillum impatiens]|uniref:isoamylase early set domain-containing protein n=1 Tax=Saccharospirillum impatiens TaxID=169438 RepID=UPI00040B63D5|nr:isoamylase early set domain-containing protein [Saccharospirillum impatiens]